MDYQQIRKECAKKISACIGERLSPEEVKITYLMTWPSGDWRAFCTLEEDDELAWEIATIGDSLFIWPFEKNSEAGEIVYIQIRAIEKR